MEKYEKKGLEKFITYYLTKYYNQKLKNKEITLQKKDDLIRDKVVDVYETTYKKVCEGKHMKEFCTFNKNNIINIIDILEEMGQIERYVDLYNRRMEYRHLSKLEVPFNKENIAEELKDNLCSENNILDIKKSEVIQTYYFNRLTKEIDFYAAIVQYFKMHPDILETNTNISIREELGKGDTSSIDEQIEHEKNKINNLEKQKSKSKKIINLDVYDNIAKIQKRVNDLEERKNKIVEKNNNPLTIREIIEVFKDKIDFDELFDIHKINQMVKVDIIKESEKMVEKYGQDIIIEDSSVDEFYRDNHHKAIDAWNEIYEKIKNKYSYLLNDETIEYMINNQTLQKVMYRVKDMCIMSLITALEIEKKYNLGYVDIRNMYTRHGNGKQFGNSIRNWGIVLNENNSSIEDNGYEKKVKVKEDEYVLAIDVANFNWPVTFHFKPDAILDHEIIDAIPVYKFSNLLQDGTNAKNNLLFGYDCKKEIVEYLKEDNLTPERKDLLMHLKFMQDGNYPKLPKTEYYHLSTGNIFIKNQIER